MNQLFNFKVFVNMKKNLFLVAMAAVAFAACSDDFADAPPVVTPVDESAFEKPIVFNSSSSNITRANFYGADAAEKLGEQFVVSGYKGSSTATVGSIVFDNFLVEWGANTANTTESNTSNWEYVGKGPIKHAIDNGVTQQSIKYWDYTKAQYDFIAWSTGLKNPVYDDAALGADDVRVSEITPGTATGASGTAFTMEGTAENLSQCYIADLVTVYKDKTKNLNGMEYGKPVTLTFRSLGTKVRIGIYETVPGYSVRNVKFYPKAGVLTETEKAQITGNARLFTTVENKIYTQGIYTIYYPTVDKQSLDPEAPNYNADNNQAHISFAPTGTAQSTTVNCGDLNYTIAEDAEKTPGNVYLGRSSNTATFAGNSSTNYYEFFIPNQEGTNLNLRVDFVLESIDGTGEIIEVKNATAQVPSVYAQWKPGFAYTYLFKISDKTNGRTGVYDPTQSDDATINSDPAGLYPITFDAMVVDAEDNGQTQETITTVSTPSITTYQQNSTVVNADEYTVNGKDIFVTVTENNAEVNLLGKAALYTIPAGKTEADVVDAMTMQDDDAAAGTVKGRNGLVLTEASNVLTNSVVFGVDGNAISVGENEAMKFTPTASTTYAFVYTKTAPTDPADKVYEPVNVNVGDPVAGYYRAGLKNAPAGDVQKGVKYFTASTKDQETVFLGQTVNNLYLDADGTTIASGYAQTGTTYYYSYFSGSIKKYNAAHVVAFEAFAGLYEEGATEGTYVLTEDTKPQDGKAYYFKDGDSYTYCVIYPQQTNPATGDRLKVIDNSVAKNLCTGSMKAVKGMEYYDMYTQNDGVYYAKIIKVE